GPSVGLPLPVISPANAAHAPAPAMAAAQNAAANKDFMCIPNLLRDGARLHRPPTGRIGPAVQLRNKTRPGEGAGLDPVKTHSTGGDVRRRCPIWIHRTSRPYAPDPAFSTRVCYGVGHPDA